MEVLYEFPKRMKKNNMVHLIQNTMETDIVINHDNGLNHKKIENKMDLNYCKKVMCHQERLRYIILFWYPSFEKNTRDNNTIMKKIPYPFQMIKKFKFIILIKLCDTIIYKNKLEIC